MAQIINSRNKLLNEAATRILGSSVYITSGTSSSLTVPANSSFTVPGTIVLTAVPSRYVSPQYTWSYRFGDSGPFIAINNSNTTTVTITGDSSFVSAATGFNIVQYKVDVIETATQGANPSSFTLTIPILRQGVNSVLGVLSNESQAVYADAEGSVPAGTVIQSTLYIYNGTNDDSANWSASISASTGITAALINGKTISVSLPINTLNGYVDITATRQGYSNIVKRFNISKILEGVPGIPGTNGIDGTTYYTWVKYGSYLLQWSGNQAWPASSTISNALTYTFESAYNEPIRISLYLVDAEGGVQVALNGTQIGTNLRGNDMEQKWYYLDAQAIVGTNEIKIWSINTDGGSVQKIDVFSVSDYPDGKTHLGIAYNKSSPIESTIYNDYYWSLIKGSDGIPGQDGIDGQTTYTWIKYADNASGLNMSDSSTGKTYIGIAVNKTTSVESSEASEYTWSLIKGADGNSTALVYAYKRSATLPTDNPGTVDYSFSTNTITTATLANNWQKEIPSGTDPLYVVVATASSNTSTDTIAAAEWAAPVLLVQNGTNGTNGLNAATVFLYARNNSTTTAPTLSTTGTATYTFSTRVLSGTIPSGWTTTIPGAASGSVIWVVQATASSSTATDSIANTEWSTPAILAQKGDTGTNGSDGVSPTSYEVSTASPVINRSASNTLTPSNLVVNAYSITGSTKSAYSGRFKIYEDGTLLYTSSTDQSTYTYTPVAPTTVSLFKVELYQAGGTTTLLDSQEIPVTVSGSSGITISISNTAFTAPADSSGAVSTYAGSGTTIQVFEGSTALTYRTTLGTNVSSFTIGTPTLSVANAITIGARSGSGTTTATVANHSAMSNSVSAVVISYPITYNRASGAQATQTVTQTITKALAGSIGVRGSRQIFDTNAAYTSAYDFDGTGAIAAGAASYAARATQLVATVTAGLNPTTPINGDTVTFTNGTNYVYTITHDGTSWNPPGTVIDGSLLVTGSVTASKINSNGLSIRDSNGNVILSAGSSLQDQIDPYESGATVGANASNLTGFDDIGNLFPDVFYKNPAWGTFTGDWLVGPSTVINSPVALQYVTESKTTTTSFIADKTTPTVLFAPCNPGETIYISAKWATASNATGTWALIPRFYDKNKVALSTGAEPNWLYMDVPQLTEASKSWKITVPTGAAYMGYRVRRGSDGANIAAVGWCEIGQTRFSRSEAGATRNVFRGDWELSSNYSIGDIVLESGYGWSCIQNHTSSSSIKPPTYPATSNTYWTAYTIKGDTGADAIVAILSNEAHVFPASNAGAVSTYSGSGTDIYVYEGANALAYDGVGTSTGTWKIATASSNITVGTITDSGSYVTIGNHSGVASGTDTSSITYTITGKTSRGASFSLTKTQTFSKSKAGVAGAQGPAVVLLSNRPASFTSTDGTLDGSQANIVFTANVQGIDSPTYAWSFSGLQTNPTASTTNTQTITAAQFGTSKSAIVTVTVNGTIVDKMTIVRLEKSTAAAGATVGATIGTNLYGKITSANASTYIANAAIGAAQIGSISLVGTNNFNVKSATTGQRMEMDSRVIKIFDASGVLRVQIGDLTI